MYRSMEDEINYWSSIAPFDLSEQDKTALTTKTDEEWKPLTWSELKTAIADHNTGIITRYPTDLRKYLLWRRQMKHTYPDISEYLITQRLNWDLPTAEGFKTRNSIPLADPSDYTFRRNDWPYAIEHDIGHVVIWLKTRIPTNEEGEPTPESTELLETFVQKTFRDEVNKTNSKPDAEIIWFKNPVKWQSVRTLEHFHVMTNGVDDSLIEKWTKQTEKDTIGRSWEMEVEAGTPVMAES